MLPAPVVAWIYLFQRREALENPQRVRRARSTPAKFWVMWPHGRPTSDSIRFSISVARGVNRLIRSRRSRKTVAICVAFSRFSRSFGRRSQLAQFCRSADCSPCQLLVERAASSSFHGPQLFVGTLSCSLAKSCSPALRRRSRRRAWTSPPAGPGQGGRSEVA